MKIGVDACCWGNKRGFGRFTRELLEAVLELDKANEYLFFIDSHTADSETIPANAKIIVADTEVSAVKAASAEGRRSIRDLAAMTRAVWREKVDVFFFPAVYSYFPIFNRAKIVVTIHDMIADHHPKLVFPNNKLKLFWKLKQNAAVRQADLILTVSEFSKRQIAEFFKLKDARLRVVTEGARAIFKVLPRTGAFRETLFRYGLRSDEKFLLYVGGISPHKNLNTLIAAFKKISRTERHVKLVLVGDYKDDPFFSAYPALKKQIAAAGLQKKIVFAGFVPDEDLVCLYNAAAALVFPSLEEGFGLPAIEAMACGTPVVASNTSSLPEILGAAGRFFDPRDALSIAKIIEEVLAGERLRRSMSETGLERTALFNWETAAKQTLRVFNELNKNPSGVETISPETMADLRRL